MKWQPLLILYIFFASCNVDKGTWACSTEIKWGQKKFRLTHCTASYNNSQVNILVKGEQDDTTLSPYELRIIKSGGASKASVRQIYSVTDSSYVPAYFKTVYQKFFFNKKDYRKGDLISGSVDLLFLGHEQYFRNTGEMELRKDFDTVTVHGTFSALVK